MDQETKQQFERINKKLNDLLASKQQTDHWVGVSWVTELTGWTPEKLRQARESNLIEYKRSKSGGYLYKLESIPEHFIKQKQAS